MQKAVGCVVAEVNEIIVPIVPVTELAIVPPLAVNVATEPAQTAAGDCAIVTAVGVGFIVTDPVVAELEQPLFAVSVKVPPILPIVTVGFCEVALGLKVQPTGPVQE